MILELHFRLLYFMYRNLLRVNGVWLDASNWTGILRIFTMSPNKVPCIRALIDELRTESLEQTVHSYGYATALTIDATIYVQPYRAPHT